MRSRLVPRPLLQITGVELLPKNVNSKRQGESLNREKRSFQRNRVPRASCLWTPTRNIKMADGAPLARLFIGDRA